jgi:hypothetical protein
MGGLRSAVSGQTVGRWPKNFTFLARQLYPTKNSWPGRTTSTSATRMRRHRAGRTIGTWVAERLRSELYTIGLFMNRGTAAWNNRSIYGIQPAPAETMEGVLSAIGPPVLFVDFLHQTRQAGNEWFFDRIVTREWAPATSRWCRGINTMAPCSSTWSTHRGTSRCFRRTTMMRCGGSYPKTLPDTAAA